MENNNAVEEQGQNPQTEEQQDKTVQEEVVTLTKAEADALVSAAEEATKLAEKESTRAQDYFKGMEKYKSKLKDAGIDEEEVSGLTEEKIAEIVRKEVEAIKQTIQPQDTELEKQRKIISELKNALQNRPTSAPSSGGSNLDKPEVKTSKLTPEQQAYLKARGISEEEFIKNMNIPGAPGTKFKNE